VFDKLPKRSQSVKISTPIIATLSLYLAASSAVAQELSSAQKAEIVKHAQPLYYSPIEHGLVSVACNVKLDWETVPKVILVPAEIAGRDRLQSTKLRLTLNANGKPEMTREYARDTPVLMKPVFDRFFDWASSVVTGFFLTWGSKAMRSPIPTGHYISTVIPDQDGYQIASNSGGAVITLSLSKDYVIRKILTTAPGQTIDEHSTYTSSPEGLLLTSVDATNKTAEGATHVSYDVDYLPIDTILFPNKIHLVVDNNIDMKFTLENCSAEQATVFTVRPPS
jgi:hypothetical protein